MAEAQRPNSPSLLPPRRSVELDDSGAHELDSSDENEDVFADAQDSRDMPSAPHSPVPTTRVEKVDDEPSYGEVPGTPAYKMRMGDAVPDEVEIRAENRQGRHSRTSSQQSMGTPLRSPGGTIIPKTVVEKIDPLSLSHGETPRTKAHSKRQADAVPDVIMQAPPPGKPRTSGSLESKLADRDETVSVPWMVVTRVDSQPAHGEVPGTPAAKMRSMDAEPDELEIKHEKAGGSRSSLGESSYFERSADRSSRAGSSPIAADGGFGPMDYDESEDGTSDDEGDRDKEKSIIPPTFSPHEPEDNTNADDFDDFEEGATAEDDDDFGDFDDGFQQAEEPEDEEEGEESEEEAACPTSPSKQAPLPEPPFYPLPDFSSLPTLQSLLDATSPHLSTLFPTHTPSTASPNAPPPPPTPPTPLLTSRSASLYAQLTAPPPLQPPDWLRSRIRRLFLVSLGVPVDLDEILPASKQKKLVLPYTPTLPPTDKPGAHSVARLKGAQNASTTSLGSGASRSLSPTKAGKGSSASAATTTRRRGPEPPPKDLDLPGLRILCGTTAEALRGMEEAELQAHVQRLEEVTQEARVVLEYWLVRKDTSLGEKEAFEGVIGNLVRFARRVRK